MSDHCFWILTDGTIVIPDTLHIRAVVSAPSAFGESIESLKETFEPYGQGIQSNYEGKAREETLTRVIKRNHIRLRKNHNKRNQHWSVQLYKLTAEREQAIAQWAKYVSGLTDDKYADVIIHQFHDGSEIRTSLDQLVRGYDDAGEPEVLSQAELTRIYK
ncbi:hypothetical protein ACFL0S_00550 [Thermodesulfobacteriota bacterium]